MEAKNLEHDHPQQDTNKSRNHPMSLKDQIHCLKLWPHTIFPYYNPNTVKGDLVPKVHAPVVFEIYESFFHSLRISMWLLARARAAWNRQHVNSILAADGENAPGFSGQGREAKEEICIIQPYSSSTAVIRA